MPKKKTPDLDPKEQFKRFVEEARKRGVDENENALAKKFKSLAQAQTERPSKRS